ncbi:hypothetical protein LZW29_01170 [Campylobacter coli]|nr:hypothetical protein [Campylobacter coli]
MFKIKTTPKVVSLWSRALQKAVSYFLDLKNIFLISSLKSVINTAVAAMNVFRKSIVDYFLGVISSRIFGFTTKSFKEMIIRCNTNNLLKNESAFESIELKEEEEEKFTLDFLIESNKTSVLSVFKGKII